MKQIEISSIDKSHKNIMMEEQMPLRTEGAFTLYPTALIANRKPTWEEFESAYSMLLKYKGAIAWWMGDLLNIGEGTFSERYAQVIDPTYQELETIRNWAWIASKVPIVLRHSSIQFGVYQLVAKLPYDKQEEILKKALDEGLRVEDVRAITSCKGKALEDPAPVAAMAFAASIPEIFKTHLEKLPIEKWQPEALKTVKNTFESAVNDTKAIFGW